MRVVICDDNEEISNLLEGYLREFFEKNKIKQPEYVKFHSGEDLICDEGNVDIAFLDVEMPGLSGIHVGDVLKKKNSQVIVFIVTAYPEYLDDAMKIKVFRYLSKPVDKKRLFRNMKDALRQYSLAVEKVAVETKEKVTTLYAHEIICIEARARRTYVYTATETYCSIHNMQYWKEKLNKASFFQTHRSYIVNMKHVSKFDNTLVYFDKLELTAYLTRRKYKEFKDSYLLYVESMR